MDGQREDELDDTDQENPVEMSKEAWSDYYAKHPDALDHGDDSDYY